MPNLDLELKHDLSSFRRIAIGTWRNAYDPSVYGTLELRMDRALAYIEAFRARTGKRLTVSHLVVKAVAMALKEMPEANAVLRWNRIYLRRRIGIFCQVVMTDEGADKADLSGVTIYDVERKSLVEIVGEFEERVAAVRARRDPALERTRSTFRSIPYACLNWALRTLSFLCYTLNLDLTRFGVPNDPFGSVMITNIGSIGLDSAYVPLVPYSRVPILVALGAVRELPVVDEGTVKPARLLNLCATFDHRVIDGFHASVMARVLRSWLEHPDEHFDALPPAQLGAAS